MPPPEEPNYIIQKRQQEIAEQQRDNSSWLLPWAAGIGAVALGAKIFKTQLAREGNIYANMLHFLGHPTALNTEVDKIANSGASTAASGASGIKSLLNSVFNIKKNTLQLGPIDLIQDLSGSMDILGGTAAGEVRNTLKERLTEFVNRRHVNYGNHTSFFGDKLQRATVGEVLSNQSRWYNVIGKNQWNTLTEAVEEGLVSHSTVLDKNIYTTVSGSIRDTRLRSVFMKSVQDKNYNFGLVPKVDLFGQFNVFQSLFGEKRAVAVLGGTDSFSGPRYFIGGNVLGYSKVSGDVIEEQVLQTGQKLRRIGDRLEPIRAAREDRLQLDVKQRTSAVGQLVSKFEKLTGVGTSFSSRRSFFDLAFINPIKRTRALIKGEAQLVSVETGKQDYISTFVDQAVGAEAPELIQKSVKAGKAVGAGTDFKDLPWYEKLLTIFDLSPKFSLVKNTGAARIRQKLLAGERTYIRPEEYFTAPVGSGGYTIKRSPLDEAYRSKPSVEKPLFYAAPESRLIPGITSTKDLTSYLAFRTSHLASATLAGISYAPAKSLVGNLTRLAAVPIIYGAAAEAIDYADYVSESITGISPKKTLASIYAGLRIAQQSARSAVGVQQGLKALEENYPGSVDSGLGFVLRNIAAPVATFAKLAKSTTIGKALAGAGAVLALIGGESPGQSPGELIEEYSGERKVPIRKGRFWFMGNTPMEGGEISRYDYSWYHKLMSDYRYRSTYGSKDEYYTYHSNVFGIPFPTPSNLGGLLNIFNPYRLEEINKGTRPYEVTGPMFENVPVFGPILGSTIGKLIKPTIERPPEKYLSNQGVLPEGLDPSTARDLGIPEINSTAPSYDDPIARLQKMANIATEPLGVYKFAMEFFGVKFTPSFQERADSSMLDSPARRLYAMQLGGAFGQTEFLRRFMLSDYGITANTASMVNRTRNTMPSFLPGKGSEFERDKSYFIDFSSGDPFLKIEDAESRLPGPGYEALNKLHSGRPGEYDVVDKFLILADVAPYSQAFKTYKKQVQGMQLDPYYQAKVERALDYKKGMTSIENRYPRHIDSLININNELGSNPIYDVTRGLYDFVTHDILAEVPWLGSKLAPFRDPYEKYRKQYVEGSEFPSWFHPYEDIVRPAITDTALSNPIIGAVKGAGIAFMMSGPLRFMNPLANAAGGLHSALNLPAISAGAVLGAGVSTARIMGGLPSNYVPEHVQAESDAVEYLDKLTYLKNRSLENYTLSAGMPGLSSQFKKMQGKTMVGATNPMTIRASLPRSSDKRYFDIFAQTPEENRQELVEGLPAYMGYALNRYWSGGKNRQATADQEVAEYFSEREIPSSDWLGWHPSVDTPSMKLKMIQHGLNGISDNYHRFGFYESHERTLNQIYPDLAEQSVTFTAPPNYSSLNNFYQTVGQNIAQGLGASTMNGTSHGARFTTRIQMDRSSEVKNNYRREYR